MIRAASKSEEFSDERRKNQAVHFFNAIEALCVDFYARGGVRPCDQIEFIMGTASLGVNLLAGERNESNAPLTDEELNVWITFLKKQLEGKDSLADICDEMGI